MIFSIQRLRNLTTRRLHTEMTHIYQDIDAIIGEDGAVMTHMIPRLMESIDPWLREQVTDERYWDGQYDTTHIGEIELPDPSEDDRKAFLERYMSKPDPLEGKEVFLVKT